MLLTLLALSPAPRPVAPPCATLPRAASSVMLTGIEDALFLSTGVSLLAFTGMLLSNGLPMQLQRAPPDDGDDIWSRIAEARTSAAPAYMIVEDADTYHLDNARKDLQRLFDKESAATDNVDATPET